MPEITLEGYRIFTRDEGSGRAVLFIHGLAGAGRFWEDTLKRLPRGLRGIAPDLLGFGDSDKPETDYSIADHAERMRKLIEALGITSLDLVGHSMGGMIALMFTLQFPEKVGKLVLVNTPVNGSRALHGRGRIGATSLGIAMVKIGLKIPWILWMLRRSRRYYFVLDPRFTEDAGKATFHSLNNHARALRRTDLEPCLKEIGVPTLVMGTKEDGIVRPSEFSLAADKIPGARMVWVRNAGHCPTLERPEESHEAIFNFLAENM